VFTAGPLGYLTFPQDIGHNLVRGLLFQTAVWAVLIVILADLFFGAGFPLWSLVFFSAFVGIASPLFWFNRMGLEDLLLVGALVLLVIFYRQGGIVRYVTALLLLGITPLIKLSGGAIAAAALAGFLLDRAIQCRWRAWRETVLALVIPTTAAAAAWWWTQSSWDTLSGYLKASAEIVSGYSGVMSLPSAPVDFRAAAEALVIAGMLLFSHTRRGSTE